MSKKIICLLGFFALLSLGVIANDVESTTYSLPIKVVGGEVGSSEGATINVNEQKVWELTRVWPATLTQIDNYKPLTWLGKYWGSSENSHGGQPSIKIEKSAITLAGRGACGKSNPGAKLPALIFNCNEAGTYSVSAKVIYNTWDGNGKGAFLLLRVSEGKIAEVAKHAVNDKKGDFDFSATDIELKANDKLIITLQFNSQSATAYTLKDFAIKKGVSVE